PPAAPIAPPMAAPAPGAPTALPTIAPVPAPSTPPTSVPFSRVDSGCPEHPETRNSTASATPAIAVERLSIITSISMVSACTSPPQASAAEDGGQRRFLPAERRNQLL